ncbi:hypothetical protein L1887_57161 [Cichorium endivia]|nr:hypothetical protein L1887_57161 [Cichorium endivia]
MRTTRRRGRRGDEDDEATRRRGDEVGGRLDHEARHAEFGGDGGDDVVAKVEIQHGGEGEAGPDHGELVGRVRLHKGHSQIGIDRAQHRPHDGDVPVRERSLGDVCDNQQTDIVGEADAPESEERQQRPRVDKDVCAVGPDPRNVGADLQQQRREPEQRRERRLLARLARLHHVAVRAGNVAQQSEQRKHQKRVVERQVEARQLVGHHVDLGEARDVENTPVPEDGSAHRTGQRIDGHDHQDALDGTAEGRKEERARVELLPCGEVKVGKRSNERCRSPDRPAKVEGSTAKHALECRVDRITAVVEEFAERTGHARPARLLSVDRVEALVGKQTQRPGVEDPGRQTPACCVRRRGKVDLGRGGRDAKVGEERCDGQQLGVGREGGVQRARVGGTIELELRGALETRVDVGERSKVDKHEQKTRKRDGVGRDALGKELHKPVPIRPEDVLGDERLVGAAVLVQSLWGRWWNRAKRWAVTGDVVQSAAGGPSLQSRRGARRESADSQQEEGKKLGLQMHRAATAEEHLLLPPHRRGTVNVPVSTLVPFRDVTSPVGRLAEPTRFFWNASESEADLVVEPRWNRLHTKSRSGNFLPTELDSGSLRNKLTGPRASSHLCSTISIISTVI